MGSAGSMLGKGESLLDQGLIGGFSGPLEGACGGSLAGCGEAIAASSWAIHRLEGDDRGRGHWQLGDRRQGLAGSWRAIAASVSTMLLPASLRAAAAVLIGRHPRVDCSGWRCCDRLISHYKRSGSLVFQSKARFLMNTKARLEGVAQASLEA